MTSKDVLRAASALAVIASLNIPAALTAQSAGGTATYVISVETDSGMAAGALRGGPAHKLALQLGSSKSAPQPQADHFVPAVLGIGPSVPLVAPVQDKSRATGDYRGGVPQAKGRMLLMWGCGETVKSGNRREIDLANPAKGSFGGLQARSSQDLASRGLAGYAEWPNAKNARDVPGRGSLVGAHKVSGNYTPAFGFDLAAEHDFLSPLALSQAQTPGGATKVDWQGIGRATGYFLTVVGTMADGTVVMWNSSDVPMQDSLMGQYLPGAEVARLVAARAVLPAPARTCTVPREVISAVPTPMLMMSAFADEADLAQPKPAGAAPGWKPEWTVKLRYKSGSMMMLGEAGQAMAAMQNGIADDRDEPSEDPKPAKKKRGLLGSILERAIPIP